MNIAVIIVTALLLIPFLMPWNKSLLIYSLATWFFLWGAFFIASFKESSLSERGIINNSIVITVVIVVFAISILLRSIIHFIIVNINKHKKSNSNEAQNT